MVGRGEAETALYLYASTGKKDGQRPGELGPADVLALRQGYVVADAAGIFDSSFAREGIIECGCNMHARRYFTRALDAGDSRAALPLAAFKSLYQFEAQVRARDPAERLASPPGALRSPLRPTRRLVPHSSALRTALLAARQGHRLSTQSRDRPPAIPRRRRRAPRQRGRRAPPRPRCADAEEFPLRRQ